MRAVLAIEDSLDADQLARLVPALLDAEAQQ
jgi:hypothetical protein